MFWRRDVVNYFGGQCSALLSPIPYDLSKLRRQSAIAYGGA
ncbi:MAG TPA: hypothetical protein V6D25_21550 [Leptolyngbyaceae cyanobacterium]